MTDQQRKQGRQRIRAYRERRRYGRVLVSVEIGPSQLTALELLALLDTGETNKARIALAVSRFLDTAPHVSAMAEALWSDEEEPTEQA
jgi:hypothetical protein